MRGFSSKTSVVSIGKICIDPKQILKSGSQNGDPLNQEGEYLAAVLALHCSCSQQDERANQLNCFYYIPKRKNN